MVVTDMVSFSQVHTSVDGHTFGILYIDLVLLSTLKKTTAMCQPVPEKKIMRSRKPVLKKINCWKLMKSFYKLGGLYISTL